MQQQLETISNLALFARIVMYGGISRCAEKIGTERTTVGRRLADLERTLGVELFCRSAAAPGLAVSEAGLRCLEQCLDVRRFARNARAAAIGSDNHGTRRAVSIATTPEILEHLLARPLDDFTHSHADVKIKQRIARRAADGGAGNAELLVRWASTKRPTGMVRRLANVRQRLYASADLLAHIGRPRRIAELRKLPCIVEPLQGPGSAWQFLVRRKVQRVSVNARHLADDPIQAREAAIQGLGIARLPDFLGDPFVRYGRLVRVLPRSKSIPRSLISATSPTGLEHAECALLRTYLEVACNLAGSVPTVARTAAVEPGEAISRPLLTQRYGHRASAAGLRG